MSSGKLHLKRTPAEQAEREWRKAQKAARKAARKKRLAESASGSDEHEERIRTPSGKRQRTHHSHSAAKDATTGACNEYEFVFTSDNEYGPPPPPSPSTYSSHSHREYKPDYEQIRVQLEEEHFREKMWGALEDDERLDSVESRLNSYAHVPRRWRGGGMDRMDDELNIDPHLMEEEDYMEWVRAGMWRKRHAAEYAEQERRKTQRASRHAREKAIREETIRLQKAAEDDRSRRRKGRERRREAEARKHYDMMWKDILGASDGREQDLRFTDIPWPVMLPDIEAGSKWHKGGHAMSIEDLTLQAISAFLLPADCDDVESGAEAAKKERKEKLRETMLRFHPDKFEGRVLKRVRESDRESVKEAVGIVVRAIGELMGGANSLILPIIPVFPLGLSILFVFPQGRCVLCTL
ncbi:hypothetical protein AcW1_003891 [Taiwanofungus camphoratus]|nr:hypothetical protein AcW1_003891 [Antrodia cinnamomea]